MKYTFTHVLMPLIILSSFNENKPYPNSFYALILLMQFAFMGVFTAQDGLLFYIFWELVLIPIWFISGLWGQENKRIKTTRKFFLYTFLGSLSMLVGLIFTYQFSESFSVSDLVNNQLNSVQQQRLLPELHIHGQGAKPSRTTRHSHPR